MARFVHGVDNVPGLEGDGFAGEVEFAGEVLEGGAES